MVDYKKEIDKLEKKYNEKRKEIAEIQNKLIKAIDNLHESSGDYEKIECPKCNGEGYYRNKEGQLKKCDNCIDSRGFIYAKKYKGNNNE
jgi:NAD-dependent SIR2 family protein deacetylase